MAPRICFYTDEHIAHAVIHGLRQRGVDVLTTVDAGMLNASDEGHLALAHENSRVVVTQDEDFLRLHSLGIPHSGIAYAPQGTSIGSMISGLMLIAQVLDPEEMVRHVEFI